MTEAVNKKGIATDGDIAPRAQVVKKHRRVTLSNVPIRAGCSRQAIPGTDMTAGRKDCAGSLIGTTGRVNAPGTFARTSTLNPVSRSTHPGFPHRATGRTLEDSACVCHSLHVATDCYNCRTSTEFLYEPPGDCRSGCFVGRH